MNGGCENRRRMRFTSFSAGLAIASFFLIIAVMSMLWTPYPTDIVDIANKLTPPSAAFLLGTDHLGRDVLSLAMAGARISILVAFFAVGLGAIIGIPLGLAASATRGFVDDFFMRANDIIFAFPAIIIALLAAAIFGPSATNAIIAIGIFNIPVFARTARGAALSLWQRPFILSAQTSGLTKKQIAIRHILPNIAPILIVQATVQFSMAVLAESGLAYLGLSAQPPVPSWGRMLADSQSLMITAPWLAIVAGACIFLFVFALNLMGDGLREKLDPKNNPS